MRDDDVLSVALGALAGSALVLDRERRIRLATEDASELLGRPIPLGVSAAKVLCGGRLKRPIGDALEAGRAAAAMIPFPGDSGTRRLRVQVIPQPLRAPRAFVVLLEDAGIEGANGPVLFHRMWTQDARMKDVFRVIERVAADDDTVLVRGDSGTGKELVAAAIHELSSRRKGPLRAINCAALPPNLLESELFGHVRGAFTGAHRDTPGHIQLAHGGTLFLDEVAELPLDVQAKLLRVLETHTVIPVGGREPLPVDVRIVSATHRALRKEAQAGRFRADLLYRLRVIPIFLPPLRARHGDVALLCEKLIAEMNAGRRRRIERVSPAALDALERHSWPGNIRELRNVLAYAFAIGDGPVLLPSDLPPELVSGESEVPDVEQSGGEPGQLERDRIEAVLRRFGGRRERAAAELGVSRVTLWRRMRELGLAKR
jgi:transcriptional regulator with PAS, ATPase and Fis domain